MTLLLLAVSLPAVLAGALLAAGWRLAARLSTGALGDRPERAATLRVELAALVGLELVVSLLGLAGPWPLQIVVDNVIGGRRFGGLLAPLGQLPTPTVVAVVVGGGVVSVAALAVATYVADVLSVAVAEVWSVQLRSRVFGRLVRLPLTWHGDQRSGDLVVRLTSDVSRVRNARLARVEVLLPSVVTLAGMTAVLAALDLRLALVVAVLAPALVATFRLRQRGVAASQRVARAAAGDLAGRIAAVVPRVPAVQAFGQEPAETATLDALGRRAGRSEVAAARASARLRPVADLLLAVDLAAVLALGAALVAAHRLSVGGLLVFLTYLGELAVPVGALSRLSRTLGLGSASAERLERILAAPGPGDGPAGRAAPAGAPELSARHVSFAYGDGRPALRDVSFRVPAGTTACVHGPSGAGKSTLLALLQGLAAPASGSLAVDGVDVRAYDPDALRRAVAIVPQEVWLLDGTVHDNIAYGRPGATVDDVRRAGRLAHVDEFADRLPAGWDTPVGEGGHALSGGQRRRVALARALLKDAPVLLLDEPTTGLDPAAERVVLAAVRSAAASRTTVLVTHRADLLALADQVIELVDGRTVPRPALVATSAG